MDPLRDVIERLLDGIEGPGAPEALAMHRAGLLEAAAEGQEAIAAYFSSALAKHERTVEVLRRELEARTRE